MIDQAPLAKKGSNRPVDVWLKVRRVERCWIVATLHVKDADGCADAMPPSDVVAKRSPVADLTKSAGQQDEEADDTCGDKTADDDETPGKWLGMAFIHRMCERRLTKEDQP